MCHDVPLINSLEIGMQHATQINNMKNIQTRKIKLWTILYKIMAIR